MDMKYTMGIEPLTKNVAIFAREKGALPFNKPSGDIPLAIFSRESLGFPLDTEKAARNIVALLNHEVPPHLLSSGDQEIFYSRKEQAVVLRTLPPAEDSRLSVPAMLITFSQAASLTDLVANLKATMDQDFMKRVCHTIVPDIVRPTTPRPPQGQTSPGM